NVRGREPEGTVARGDYERVRDDVLSALTSWRYDDGRPVVARAWRREEILSGPFVDRAPDVLVDLALVEGYSPSCLRSGGAGPAIRTLDRRGHGAGKGAGMNGAHRPDGLFVLAGDGVRAGALARCHVTDAVPTLLAAAGVPIPHGLDGTVRTAALVRTPLYEEDTVPPPTGERAPYDAAAAREVADRLAALGYVEAAR
ncbi:MAG TPA: hypothetical protein VMS22_07445, partial [Candidatus Eisenbacteria bacterium]|nr:hypothetical protein [Candidatus Eisenbacteria bacterium]